MNSEMTDCICDHANRCKQNPVEKSRVDYCSGRRPHRFNHEECSGMHCPHADNQWVKCLPIFIHNPALLLAVEVVERIKKEKGE